MRHRNRPAFDESGIIILSDRSGEVSGDVITEEVEIHPRFGTPAFGTIENSRVEIAAGLKIAYKGSEVEGGAAQ